MADDENRYTQRMEAAPLVVGDDGTLITSPDGGAVISVPIDVHGPADEPAYSQRIELSDAELELQGYTPAYTGQLPAGVKSENIGEGAEIPLYRLFDVDNMTQEELRALLGSSDTIDIIIEGNESGFGDEPNTVSSSTFYSGDLPDGTTLDRVTVGNIQAVRTNQVQGPEQ